MRDEATGNTRSGRRKLIKRRRRMFKIKLETRVLVSVQASVLHFMHTQRLLLFVAASEDLATISLATIADTAPETKRVNNVKHDILLVDQLMKTEELRCLLLKADDDYTRDGKVFGSFCLQNHPISYRFRSLHQVSPFREMFVYEESCRFRAWSVDCGNSENAIGGGEYSCVSYSRVSNFFFL